MTAPKRLVLAVGVAAALCAVIVANFVWSQVVEGREAQLFENPDRRLESRQRGEEVVARLRKYYANNAKYPKSLEDVLQSSEISLQPTAGRARWNYGTEKSQQRFWLTYGVGRGPYPCEFYDSETSRWQLDR